MQNTYTTQIQTGTSVYGSDGEKIGDVAGVSDDYFVVEKGFLFTTDVYVPFSAISGVEEDGVRLAMTKDELENVDWSNAPTTGGTTDATYASTDATYASTDDTYATDRDVLERSEERLVVDKETHQAGSVQVGKHVVEERQSVDVPVSREEITIDRRAVDRPAGAETFSDEAIDVPVYQERVETGKEARVVEELEIGKRTTTDTAHVEETVRREEFDIDESGTTRTDRS